MRFLLATLVLALTGSTAMAHTLDGTGTAVQAVGHQLLSLHHLPGMILVVVLLLLVPLSRARRRR